MTRGRAGPLSVLVVALVLTACTASEPPPLPEEAFAEPSVAAGGEGLDRYLDQELTWRDCGADGAECATLTVPVDYGEPAGDTIGLRLLRLPAGDAQGRLGSLVVNPGGPGASGVDYARAGSAVVGPEVLERYDLVGFDPRGVARSEPVECLTDVELDAYLDVDATPDTRREVRALLAAVDDLREGCQQRSGDVLEHVGTVDVAQDLDVLRAVLGDDELTYLGKSYGTTIGAEYAAQFPDRVGRMVLDGAVDPTLSGAELSLGQAGGFELAYQRFVQACLADEDGCELGQTAEEVAASATAVLAAADARPLPTDGRPLSEPLAFFGIAYPLYFPPEVGYPALEAALAQAIDGDGSLLLRLADGYLGREPDGSFSSNKNEVITVVNCLDRPGSGDVADVRAGQAAFAEASPTFGDFFVWGELGCPGWPTKEAVTAPVSATGSPPILVVGTTGDPATPYGWAQGLAEQLDSGVLLTYKGTPHTAYRGGSQCIDEAVEAFLLDGDPPQDGRTCS